MKPPCRHLIRLSWRASALLAMGLLSGSALARLDWSFSLGDVDAGHWAAQDLRLQLVSAAPGQLTTTLEVEHLSLRDAKAELSGLRLECASVQRLDLAWQCGAGRLVLDDSPFGPQDIVWRGHYAGPDVMELHLPGLRLAGGSLALQLVVDAQGWRAEVEGDRLGLAGLLDAAGLALPPTWSLQGRLDGRLRLAGSALGAQRLRFDLRLNEVAYASPDGSQAAEAAGLVLAGNARWTNGHWQLDANLDWTQGAIYSEPLFLDAGQRPVRLSLAGKLDAQGESLILDSWSCDIDQTVSISGTGSMDIAKRSIRALTLVALSEQASALYEYLARPFLLGTAVDDLEVDGSLAVVLQMDALGVEQAGLQLDDFGFVDRQGRFALGASNGGIGWRREGEVPVSSLLVDDASLYEIPIGPFGVEMRFAGERIDLLRPVVLPVLGGSLSLEKFALRGALADGEALSWQAGAALRGVSLQALTESLAWPPFSGDVSGELRDMRYADGSLTIGGGLILNAFDGEIRVDRLALREPLGAVPSLDVDARLRGLDLEALTRTFSFGRIEGRLDGDLRDMQLVAWQPDRFDLHLYTPAGDSSRRRISQRAVENLTELGSGLAGGLSSSLLGVFEEFRYAGIDLRIRLRGAEAEIEGLARPDGGYYLVKGAGLPRIDVIGRNRLVAWKDLVERLRGIQVEGAQIQ